MFDDELKDFVEEAEMGLHVKNDIIEMQNNANSLLEKMEEYVKECETNLAERTFRHANIKVGELDLNYESEWQQLSLELQKAKENQSQVVCYIKRLEKVLESYKNFNKQKCLGNIRELLKKNGNVKIGQIENEANVRVGYLSRIEKPDSTSDPTIEFVVSAAKMLDVSVDFLLNANLDEVTPTEKYLLKFIKKLHIDTGEGVLCWNREGASVLNTALDYIDHTGINHVLFTEDKKAVDCNGKIYAKRFFSSFFPEKAVEVTADVYNAVLPGAYSSIYIVPCMIKDSLKSKDGEKCCEIYIVDESGVNPVCSTLLAGNCVNNELRNLYVRIKEAYAHVQLDKKTRSLMESYMNSGNTSDEDDIELPFN